MIRSGDSILFVPTTYTTVAASTNNLAVKSTILEVTVGTNNDAITGIKSLNDSGYILIIKNVGTTNTLVLPFDSSLSTSGNRFFSVSGNDIYVAPKKMVLAVYGTGGFMVYELAESVYIELAKSAVQSIPDSTLTLVTWNTEVTKKGMIHSNVTNNSRVTMPTAGSYNCSVRIAYETWSGGFSNRYQIHIYKNGVIYKEVADWQMASSNSPTGSYPFNLIDFNANDYIEVYVLQQNGSPRNLDPLNCSLFVRKMT